MKLPAASKLTKIKSNNVKVDKPMKVVVNDFLNGDLLTEINQAVLENDAYVSVVVPHEAYRDLKLFYSLAISKLNKMGYGANSGHDGSGIYNTLEVSWKKNR